MASNQTLEQVIFKIVSETDSKKKLTLATVWPKVKPFLLMIGALIGGKASGYISAFMEAIDSILSSAKAAPNIKAIWAKVRPYVVLLSGLFGKKVKVYINAFMILIDKIAAGE